MEFSHYGYETWTVLAEEQKRLKEFEVWNYKKMLKITQMDKTTNKEVLEIISERKLLWKNILRKQNEWIDHTRYDIRDY